MTLLLKKIVASEINRVQYTSENEIGIATSLYLFSYH